MRALISILIQKYKSNTRTHETESIMHNMENGAGRKKRFF